MSPAERKAVQQQQQIDLLRAKLFTMQEAMIRSSLFDPADFSGPLSELSPIEIRRSPQASDRWLIVFAGMNTRISMPPAEFFQTIGRLNLPINVIFAKDFRQCWYQRGLLGLTGDIPGTAAYLRSHIPDGARIVTLGTSAGGFAAILFGVLLGAERVIAFGPQTKVDRTIYGRFRNIDSRLSELALESPFMDLRGVIERTPFDGAIEIHYGGDNRVDSAAALHLAGMPRVELHAHETNLHTIAQVLKDKGMLDAILGRIGGASPTPRAANGPQGLPGA